MKTPPNFKFLNPYAGLTKDPKTCHRFSSLIPREVFDYLNIICPLPGAQQTAINLIIKSLYDELRSAGINDYNPTAYLDAIRRRCANPLAPDEANNEHERRRTPRVRATNTRGTRATHPSSVAGTGSDTDDKGEGKSDSGGEVG